MKIQDKKINNFWQILKNYFNNKGALVVPTFTYSLTQKKYLILIQVKVKLVFLVRHLENYILRIEQIIQYLVFVFWEKISRYIFDFKSNML